MTRWRPQDYRLRAMAAGVPADVLKSALETARLTLSVNEDIPPIFTLRHLSYMADVEYGLLRAIVRRRDEGAYRLFRIHKQPTKTGERRYRLIAVPCAGLMRVQRWIHHRILTHARPHHASVAYEKHSKLVDVARTHCNSRWLIKLDIVNFFESINEISVFRTFKCLGYQPLVAFELARICTRLHSGPKAPSDEKWRVRQQPRVISAYDAIRMGHLPQGAPTSPMLANLAVYELDVALQRIADRFGLVYTRYADDLIFSTSADFDVAKCRLVVGKVYQSLADRRFKPNRAKTTVVRPGGRRIVLGLLVNGPDPRLTRDFRAKMRQHLYFLENPAFGPALHAKARGFSSVIGMRHHLLGLAHYAAQIDPVYGAGLVARLKAVPWPM